MPSYLLNLNGEAMNGLRGRSEQDCVTMAVVLRAALQNYLSGNLVLCGIVGSGAVTSGSTVVFVNNVGG